MKTNKLIISNFDYFNDYGFKNCFSILAEFEKKISECVDGECEEVEAISYDEEGFALFDFVEYISAVDSFDSNKYVYEFTGSVK